MLRCSTVIKTRIDLQSLYIGGMDYLDVSQMVMTLDLTIEPLAGRRKRSSSRFVQCTNLSLLADSIVEEDERFSVTLGSSDSGVSVDPTPLTVVILDNDCEQKTI